MPTMGRLPQSVAAEIRHEGLRKGEQHPLGC